MGIDFHAEKNRGTYATRPVDRTWTEAVAKLIPLEKISRAVDVGCGGGIYTKALSAMGIPSVVGLDFSETMLNAARENCMDFSNISFQCGNALNTGLADHSFDVVLERALIHHISDLEECFQEAYRVLEYGGVCLIQDRTPEDCLPKGDDHHIRGYFFERFPRLIQTEVNRRHDSASVVKALLAVGFQDIQEIKLWETRKVYEDKEDLLQDLRQRTGRSILHELDDQELHTLISYIDDSVPAHSPIVEMDRWTIWTAVKR
ncbi:MAG: class I SAM-dependent methyltransferase [Lysinibacillus sp.]